MPNPVSKTGELVEPAWKVCRLSDIASFKPGVWNGKPHDARFVQQLCDNFQKYSAGPNPHYQPYISLNHKDELQSGYVAAARMKPGYVLSLDGDGIPEPVGKWRNAGGIRQPSIEYFEPVYDANGTLIDGFRRPDGSIEPGPVLKCLTLLGADAPAVKGLPDLPFATFHHVRIDPRNPGAKARVRKFANSKGASMDRAAIIAALQALGMDTSSITDVIPDEFLKSVLDLMQAAAQNPPPTPAPDATQQMADALAGLPTPAPALPAGGVTVPGVGNVGQPSQLVMKFRDRTNPAMVLEDVVAHSAAIERYYAALAANTARNMTAVNTASAQQAHSAKFNDVTAFVTGLATADKDGFVRCLPAERHGLIALLMKCDNLTYRKFADGKTTGSELQEMKATLLATRPKIKATGEKLQDPARGNTPGGGGSDATTVDPDRRHRMLSATAQGRAVLERERAAGKK